MRAVRRFGSPATLLVFALGAAGAALAGVLMPSALFSDAHSFAAAGATMLSPGWRHTYHDPWLQAGPFELLACLAGRTIGDTGAGTPVAMDVLGALALLGVARHVLGDRWRQLLFVAVGALGLGVISDTFEIGHPSELFVTLMWLLAARAARRDRIVLAALLLGLSAGFETWGLLGAPILFLLPRLRSTILGGGLALAAAGALYAPFAVGGDFHMFQLHWTVAGTLDAHVFGEGAAFTWKMRLAESVIVVAFGTAVAVVLRRRTHAVTWIAPTATSLCRILLDPVRYGYYWDPALVLMLIGFAPVVTAPRVVAVRLRDHLRAHPPRRPNGPLQGAGARGRIAQEGRA
jgi:hypothetical protein